MCHTEPRKCSHFGDLTVIFDTDFGNRTSPSDDSNDRWKRLCLVSWAAAPVSER